MLQVVEKFSASATGGPEPASSAESPPLAWRWPAARGLIEARRNVSPRRLVAPAPGAEQLRELMALAGAAPDHGHLTPWRFVIVPLSKRGLLAEAFASALEERDPSATDVQKDTAREKAHRSPLLMVAIARLAAHEDEISSNERLVSLGAAIQNVLLGAQAMGYGAGLASGQSIKAQAIRELFAVRQDEEPVCFLSIGTPERLREPRLRPNVDAYLTSL